MKRLSLYWNTLRYLKPIQVVGRVWFRMVRARPDYSPAPALRPAGQLTRFVWRKSSLLGPQQLQFLGESGLITQAADWTDPGRSALWLYNAHYFDDLTAEGASTRYDWQVDLVDRWILENPPASGVGWAPYPTSLRLVNWIFWLLENPEAQNTVRLQSLAVQTRFLAQRLEHHILGNHLLANAKALVFSGLMFTGAEANEWYRTGMSLLAREFAEQVLPDGGHFERSPMYHNIILMDLLDLLALHAAFDRAPPAGWHALTEKMLTWAATMTHPDGEIALFNDAAFDIAPKLSHLDRYAEALGLEPHRVLASDVTTLSPSGYVRLGTAGATLIADLAPVGPDYLPAHAHADTLSFEFSIGKGRVVVNGGTSRYGISPERHTERGTANHSTLVLDDQDSSEVWGGFRVARRARVIAAEAGRTGRLLWVKGTHDGYQRLPGRPLHCREWTMVDERLEVVDRVTGGGEHSATILFYLAPNLAATKEKDGTVTLRDGPRIVARAATDRPRDLSVVPSTWHPRFGQAIANQCLRIGLQGELPICHRMTFTWEPACGC
jgi:uncharacterized heparinase superfamily protein